MLSFLKIVQQLFIYICTCSSNITSICQAFSFISAASVQYICTSLPLVVVCCHSFCRPLCPSQHETVLTELRDKQEDMDQLISTVEDLERELEKVPNSDTQSIQRDMETLRDQWLEVSGAFLYFTKSLIIHTLARLSQT